MLRKTTDANFMRDDVSTSLINTNVTAYKSFKQQRQQNVELDNMKADVQSLHNELSSIKQLLGQLLKNVNTNR